MLAPRGWQSAPNEQWLIADRHDEVGESQFAVAAAWMEDPSVWADLEEDYLGAGRAQLEDRKPRKL